MTKKIKIQASTGGVKWEIKSKVDFKIDDLNNSIYKTQENAIKSIERKGFKVEGVLRNEVIISGNGLKKNRILTLKRINI